MELYNADDFVLRDIDMVHYEVMDEGEHVWVGFYFKDGKIGHLNIFNNASKINTRYEEFDESHQIGMDAGTQGMG